LQTSGEAANLYQKRFKQSIPLKSINLNYPLSADMKNAVREAVRRGARLSARRSVAPPAHRGGTL
jgi:hypothetical protein